MIDRAEPAQRRRERALEADLTLGQHFATAVAAEPGFALVAVGGYGRSELSPFSDLDVVLLHHPGLDDDHVREVAEAIWYPMWDGNVALDHSVRDTRQMREAATTDHRAAYGARHGVRWPRVRRAGAGGRGGARCGDRGGWR